MKMYTNSGIYQIRNIINNKIYIGSSANIKKRWSEHKRDLKTTNTIMGIYKALIINMELVFLNILV